MVRGVLATVLLACIMGVAAPAGSADAPVAPGTVRAENFTRTVIYQSPQLPPRYTSWVGAWIMPDQSLMTAFTQATGPLDGRSQVTPDVLAMFGTSSLAYERDFSGLDLSAISLRSTDDGATWNQFRSDSFRAIGPHGYSGQAVMGLADGTLLRRVNGHDTMGYSSAPGTAYLQRLAPGATDWSEPQILMDPSQYTYQFSRLQRLRDGRLIATGNFWRTPAGTRYSTVPVSEQGWLLMVSSDEGLTWTNALTEPANPAERVPPNEWDVAELDDGDLLAMLRTSAPDALGRMTPVRRQAILRKQGDGWVMDPPTATPFAHSGHPELLATHEGPVLYIATNGITSSDGGIFVTRDRGATWTRLDFSPAQAYQSAYYPISLQTQDGTIHVFGHRGVDDGYRANLDQAILMDSFRLDVGAPPKPTITSAPPSATPDTTADFAFTTDSGAIAQCALDGADFADCTSPASYALLALGPHTFKVKQALGDLESAVESRTWTVLSPPPTIVDAPDDPTTELDAEFSFTGSDGAAFECALDGAEFSACASPSTYTGLGAGRHVLLVRQLMDGVAGAAVTRRWTVTGPDAPTLDTVPASGQPRRSASYGFSGSTGTYECTVDSATSYAPCTSPMGLDGLTLGAHTFSVRAMDDRGLRSDPVSHTFSVRDTVAPSLVNKPPAATTATTATFSFTGEDPQFVTFTCLLDGEPVTPCAPGQDIALPGLAVGDHSFRVSEQLAGSDAKEASFSWTVVTPPPVNTAYRDVVVADGPVGYWRLGELSGAIAGDALGLSPGTAAAGVRLGAVAGAVAGDGAASFDGKAGQVTVPDGLRLRTGNVFSLEAWVRPSKLGVTQAIVGKGSSYLLYLDQNNKVELRQPNVGPIVTSKVVVSDMVLWHHVVVTKSGGVVRAYLDGVDVTGPVTPHTVVNGTSQLVIGNGAGRFTGALDEVAVYNKALSTADVARHYAAATASGGGGGGGGEPSPSAPDVATGTPTGVTTTAATLAGTLNPKGQDTTYWFEYGTGTGYGAQTPVQGAGSGTTQAVVAAALAGLAQSTTYQFRLVARNATGTKNGADQTFTTAASSPVLVPPVVSTGTASAITPTSATLGATVDPRGQATTYVLEYGTDTGYGTQTPAQSAGFLSGDVAVSAALTGLAPATTYHFRVSATNASGTVTGADRTFQTPPAQATGGDYRQVVLADGPVGYWRLGELSGSIAADALGISPGTTAAGVRLGAVAGAVAGDGGASFDGKTGQVSVPDAARLRTGDVFSLEAWVRPSKLAITHAILSKGASYLLYLDQNKIVLRQPNVGPIVSSTASIADTTLWHHVVVTKSGGVVRVYLDGVDVTGPVTPHTVVTGTAQLVIGNGAGRFTGALDEVALYNKALTAADVARHYASR